MELSEEQRSIWTPICEDTVQRFLAMSDEAKSSVVAVEAKKAAGDNSIQATREAMHDEHFAIADADKDGLLNKSELRNFHILNQGSHIRLHGDSLADSKDLGIGAKWWAALNSITSGVDGISRDDVKMSEKIIKTIMAEIRAAHEAKK